MKVEMKKLEKQMQLHAKNLEFELAANVRDEIKALEELLFRN